MCHRIVINGPEHVERQLAKFKDFSHRGTQWHRPVVESKVVCPGVILGPHILALAEVLDEQRRRAGVGEIDRHHGQIDELGTIALEVELLRHLARQREEAARPHLVATAR